MPSGHNFTENDKPCEDKILIGKCFLLDIEIWCNQMSDCADVKIGQWYILRRQQSNVLIFSIPNTSDVLAFDTAQEAFDAFMGGTTNGVFT